MAKTTLILGPLYYIFFCDILGLSFLAGLGCYLCIAGLGLLLDNNK